MHGGVPDNFETIGGDIEGNDSRMEDRRRSERVGEVEGRGLEGLVNNYPPAII